MAGIEIVYVADDLGWSSAINAAILKAHTLGVLTGGSLMMGQAATAEAVALARQHPSLQVGWHLHLCHSKPLTCEAWPWIDSPVRAGFAIGLTPAGYRLMRDEIAAQWEAYRATGLPCAFINSHHHLHAHPYVWRMLKKILPRDFKGWIRLGTPVAFDQRKPVRDALLESWSQRRRKRSPWRSSTTLWGADRIFRMNAAEIRGKISSLPPGLHEFMFHPRRLEGDTDLQTLIELKQR